MGPSKLNYNPKREWTMTTRFLLLPAGYGYFDGARLGTRDSRRLGSSTSATCAPPLGSVEHGGMYGALGVSQLINIVSTSGSQLPVMWPIMDIWIHVITSRWSICEKRPQWTTLFTLHRDSTSRLVWTTGQTAFVIDTVTRLQYEL